MAYKDERLPLRFWAKVAISEGGCWTWTGCKDRAGYARFKFEDRCALAHRVAYEHLVGPIPSGLTIDHLCRNPPCVNPSHMEPVTGRENTLRGVSPSALHSVKTHCSNGHAFDEVNTRVWRGSRYCRACQRDLKRRQSAARKAMER